MTWLGRRAFKPFSLMLCVGAMIVLAACSAGSISTKVTSDTFTDTGSANGAISGSAAAQADKIFSSKTPGAGGNSADYHIGALDVLDISVFGADQLTREVQVSSAGMITLPLIKSVKAADLTPQQLESSIASKLSATYIQSPQVSVFVKEYNSQKITLDGAVAKPGVYPISGRVTLVQGIALAGGLSDLADQSGVLVFRVIDNRRMAARFDLSKVRGGEMPDPTLQTGDIIMVDESRSLSALHQLSNAVPLTGLFRMVVP